MVFFSLFMLYPILSSLYYVTRKWKGMSNTFIGLGNFVRMAQDTIFQAALGHNFLFMFIQVPLMIFLALVLATLLNQGIRRLRGSLRLAIFLPAVTSLVVVSVLFRVLLQTNGFLNNVLLDAHLISAPLGWLNDAFWAKVTIILAITWRWTGYNMVFFLVGLQSIDPEIYEAAEVDGASKVRQFFTITLPLLVPVILFSAVTSTSGTMQLFDEPNILTWQGGPANATMTAALYIYRQAFFVNSDFGYATAMSYVVVVISGVFAIIQMRLLGERKVR
jgi:lactose/L-arabinose transport system permease protein